MIVHWRILYITYMREKKIIRGLEDADEGRKISNEEAKEVIEEWFK